MLFQEIVSALMSLDRLRSARLDDAVHTFPGAIWLALVVGGALTIGFAFFLGTENKRADATMVVLLAALIGTVLYVALELDYPFAGTTTIGYQSFLDTTALMTAPGCS